jgi:hypothetical protein
MKLENTYKLILAGFVLFVILSCNATFTAEFPTPTNPTPVGTATAAPSPVPPTPQLILASVSLSEDNQSPNYKIKADIPTLQGSTEARIVNFNTAMTNLVNGEIAAFKKNVSQLSADSGSSDSSLQVTYALMLQRGDLWSFKFDFSFYSAGAAHPGLYSITVNYDLGQGRELALSDLFLPNSNYLETISKYCVAELSKRDIGFDSFSDGATPTPENYRNWNLTPDGLMITFDEYQVAPYAAGPQTVIVPYNELQALINPQGPLGKLNQ